MKNIFKISINMSDMVFRWKIPVLLMFFFIETLPNLVPSTKHEYIYWKYCYLLENCEYVTVTVKKHLQIVCNFIDMKPMFLNLQLYMYLVGFAPTQIIAKVSNHLSISCITALSGHKWTLRQSYKKRSETGYKVQRKYLSKIYANIQFNLK